MKYSSAELVVGRKFGTNAPFWRKRLKTIRYSVKTTFGNSNAHLEISPGIGIPIYAPGVKAAFSNSSAHLKITPAIDIPINDAMITVKELREQAKSYGLRGYSTLRKHGLIRLIAEARAPVLLKRAARARKTGRYPALTRADVDNPHKKGQRIRELRQLNDEVTAALRGHKYAQTIKAQPRQRLKPLRQLYRRLKWKTHHWTDKEPLASKIVRKGP